MHSPPQPPTDAGAALLGDGKTLHDILSLAGPDIAPRLVAQIVSDLTATAAQLAPAIAASDWTAIRAQSHVLISLAGTLGAMGMHADACRLNEAAHGQDRTEVARLAPRVTADLSALVAAVSALGAAR